MPKIRKKTSKRLSIKDRESRKKKVKDGRKKNKKLAKKDVTWKSRTKKDPGMPNAMPFKDLIIAEMEQAKHSEEQERVRQKELQRKLKASEVETMSGVSFISQGVATAKAPALRSKEDEGEDEAPPLIDHSLPDLEAAIARADIVAQVLDARDPASFRIPAFEKLVEERGKKHIMVLNKIDLVPLESAMAWTSRLRKDFPTAPFRSASAFLPEASGSGSASRDQGKGKQKLAQDDEVGGASLRDLIHGISQEISSSTSSAPLTVAFVGLTNSGKSSVINSLLHQSVQPIYRVQAVEASTTPTTTLYPRSIADKLEINRRAVILIDTPGMTLSKPVSLTEDEVSAFAIREMLLRRRGRLERIKDSVPAVSYLVSRSNTEDLMVLYNAPAFQSGDTEALLKHVARSTGRLSHRGVPDLQDAASTVLRDWRTGKFSIYTVPPKSQADSNVLPSSAEPLKVIYDAMDKALSGSARTLKEMIAEGTGLNLVRFRPGEPLDWSVDLSARYEPTMDHREAVLRRVRQEMDEDEEEDEDEEGMDVDNLSEEEDQLEDDQDSFGGFESDDEMAPVASPPPSSAKRKRAVKSETERVRSGPLDKKKKVSFSQTSKGVPDAPRNQDKLAQKEAKGSAATTKGNTVKKSLKVANRPLTTASSKSLPAVESSETAYDFAAHFKV